MQWAAPAHTHCQRRVHGASTRRACATRAHQSQQPFRVAACTSRALVHAASCAAPGPWRPQAPQPAALAAGARTNTPARAVQLAEQRRGGGRTTPLRCLARGTQPSRGHTLKKGPSHTHAQVRSHALSTLRLPGISPRGAVSSCLLLAAGHVAVGERLGSVTHPTKRQRSAAIAAARVTRRRRARRPGPAARGAPHKRIAHACCVSRAHTTAAACVAATRGRACQHTTPCHATPRHATAARAHARAHARTHTLGHTRTHARTTPVQGKCVTAVCNEASAGG
jgi:hypothetical protein